jgi:phage terminase large subunit-like protein
MGLGLNFKKSSEIKLTKTKITSLKQIEFKEPVFCSYQMKMITNQSEVLVVEKGRQIGFSHSFAFKAVLECLSGKRNFLYSSYNLQSAKDFIKSCHYWANIFNSVAEVYEIEEFINDRSMNVLEMKFDNGFYILSIPGDAKGYRGKSNLTVLIDEAAYREAPLEDVLASAMAILIHGGQIIIGSTHCGIDGDFNTLCENIRRGKLSYELIKVTFKDAINDGLYKRICSKEGKLYSTEAQEEFIKKIYGLYGLRASEELDAVPGDFSEEGKIFIGLKTFTGSFENSYEWLYFRYHDLAASDNKNETAFYSASVKIGLFLPTNQMVVVGYDAEQLLPLEGDNRIVELAQADDRSVTQIIEIEPGSSGKKYVEYMKEKLMKLGIYNVDGYQPVLNKLTRAIPAANGAMAGELVIIDEPWKDDFNKIIKRFSAKKMPLVYDVVDCISGIWDYVHNIHNYLG